MNINGIEVDDNLIMELIDGISPDRKKMKHRELCSKTLQYISEKYPEMLYDKWNIFVNLLESDNAFSKLPVVYILANLAKIDKEKKFEKAFNTYFGLLNDKSVAISSHVAANSVKIINAKPNLEGQITASLLDIDKTNHTPDHKALIKSYIIEAFSEYFENSTRKDEIIGFIMNQLDSISPKTRKVAKQFLKNNKLL